LSASFSRADSDSRGTARRSHKSQLGDRSDSSKRLRAWAKSSGAAWNAPAAKAFHHIELA
jgi:hypothetical protein